MVMRNRSSQRRILPYGSTYQYSTPESLTLPWETAIRFLWLRGPNQQATRLNGAHFLMEDSPNGVGDAIARFVQQCLCRANRASRAETAKPGEPLSVGQPRRQYLVSNNGDIRRRL